MQPAIRAIGSSLWVIWSDDGVSLEFSRILEHRDVVTAEVTITSTTVGEVHWSRLNLLAGQSRIAVAKACAAAAGDLDWRTIMDRSAQLVVRHLRAGDPAVPIHARPPNEERWLVEDLIPLHHITVLYGDGGAGKSLLALALGVSGLQGYPLSRRWKVGSLGRVLYLDWEADAETLAERLWGLTEGREKLQADRLLYRRLHRPLTDHIDQVQAEVAKQGVDFIVTDSLGAACGPEPESADAAVRTLMALRSLAATNLVVAHVNKASADSNSGAARPYGSVYVANLARSTIEARRQEATGDESEGLTITLYHRKSNSSRLARASALAVTFEKDGRISLRGAEPDMTRTNLPTQILAALTAGAQTRTEIAETIGADADSVSRVLRRLATADKVIRITRTAGGRGQETQWGLPVRPADNVPF